MAARPSMKQIAREAGVSTQTVSRVLNKRPDVALETRQRIQDIIDRLEYQPNALARSLIHQRSLTIGVIIANLGYHGPSQILSGIARQAEHAGYTIILKELLDPHTDDFDPALRSLLARRVDGIIWAMPGIGGRRNWAASRVKHRSTPLLSLTEADHPGLTVVAIDNYRGGYLATQHLLARGCRHIGHITGPLDWLEADLRRRGWAEALAEAGLPPAAGQCVIGDWTSKSGMLAFRRLLEQYPEMDAVFVANDQMAFGALNVAWQSGRRVPDQLAVIGFDDLPESAYMCPPLTTIHQDPFQLGCAAVEEIVQMIDAAERGQAPEEAKLVLVSPELVVRQS